MRKMLSRALGILIICAGLVGVAVGISLTIQCQITCNDGSKSPIIFAFFGLALTAVGLGLLFRRDSDTRTRSEKRMDAFREAHRRSALSQKRQQKSEMKRMGGKH